MTKPTTQQISICTICKHKGTTCRAGYELVSRLATAVSAAQNAITEDFEISGTAALQGCDRPCLVAYHGSQKGTYLFGDVTAQETLPELLNYLNNHCDDNGVEIAAESDLGCRPAAVIVTKPAFSALH